MCQWMRRTHADQDSDLLVPGRAAVTRQSLPSVPQGVSAQRRVSRRLYGHLRATGQGLVHDAVSLGEPQQGGLLLRPDRTVEGSVQW